jgi:D-glycero-D-manno-heptose 1,7-bisphosphate phosphatase
MMTDMKPTPVLYTDIDGTIRKGKDELGHFVNRASDVEVFEEVPYILRQYQSAGWRIVGISNQGGIALGVITAYEARKAMIETAKQCEDPFVTIAMCPHHPDAKETDAAVCWCRKPRAGLVVQAALQMSAMISSEFYPPHLALFVGDRPEDRGCADAANITFMDAAEWRDGGWRTPLGLRLD